MPGACARTFTRRHNHVNQSHMSYMIQKQAGVSSVCERGQGQCGICGGEDVPRTGAGWEIGRVVIGNRPNACVWPAVAATVWSYRSVEGSRCRLVEIGSKRGDRSSHWIGSPQRLLFCWEEKCVLFRWYGVSWRDTPCTARS